MKQYINELKIKDIHQLLKSMNDITYGYMSKNGDIKKEFKNFYRDYKLQSPQEVLDSKVGVCWDQVEFERHFFQKLNIKHNSIYIEQLNKNKNTHTFIVYEEKNKFYWFEHSFENHKGIHGPFDSINDIIDFVHKKMENIEKDNGYISYLYKKPNFGIGVNDFINFCKRGKAMIKSDIDSMSTEEFINSMLFSM